MVSVLQSTIEWNFSVNKSIDKILNCSDNEGLYLKERENNSMKHFSLTDKWVSKVRIIELYFNTKFTN